MIFRSPIKSSKANTEYSELFSSNFLGHRHHSSHFIPSLFLSSCVLLNSLTPVGISFLKPSNWSLYGKGSVHHMLWLLQCLMVVAYFSYWKYSEFGLNIKMCFVSFSFYLLVIFFCLTSKLIFTNHISCCYDAHITSLLNPEHFFWLGNFFFKWKKSASGEFMFECYPNSLTEEWHLSFTSCVVTVFHVRHYILKEACFIQSLSCVQLLWQSPTNSSMPGFPVLTISCSIGQFIFM